MSKIILICRYRWVLVLALALCVALPACRKAEEPPAASTVTEVSPSPAPPAEEGLRAKVKVVEVTKDGGKVSVDKSRVHLKKREDIIVWVTNGESMTITWKGDNPLPKLVCEGRFCGSLVPSDAPAGVYSYSVTVDGENLDPEVEVEG